MDNVRLQCFIYVFIMFALLKYCFRQFTHDFGYHLLLLGTTLHSIFMATNKSGSRKRLQWGR